MYHNFILLKMQGFKAPNINNKIIKKKYEQILLLIRTSSHHNLLKTPDTFFYYRKLPYSCIQLNAIITIIITYYSCWPSRLYARTVQHNIYYNLSMSTHRRPPRICPLSEHIILQQGLREDFLTSCPTLTSSIDYKVQLNIVNREV